MFIAMKICSRSILTAIDCFSRSAETRQEISFLERGGNLYSSAYMQSTFNSSAGSERQGTCNAGKAATLNSSARSSILIGQKRGRP
jgi:hypothetical protein